MPTCCRRAGIIRRRRARPPILGMEVSGTMAALGEGVSGLEDRRQGLRPAAGRRLCRICRGRCRLRCCRCRDGVDLVEAAGLPEAAFTAWTNIMDTGRLQPGETLLIHGGTSGIGSLGDPDLRRARPSRLHHRRQRRKMRRLRAAWARRAPSIIASEDFVAVMKDETGGKGVDVILDMVGGDYIQRNIEAAAVWGRIVNIAYQKGVKAEVNFAPVLTKRLTLAATTLRGRTPRQKQRHPRCPAARGLAAAGNAGSSRWWTGFSPWPRPRKAHEFMAKTGHIGKILLEIGLKVFAAGARPR